MKVRNRKSTRTMLLFLGIAAAFLLTACSSASSSTSASTTQISTRTDATNTSTAPISTNATALTQIDPLQAIRMIDTNNGWALTTQNEVLKTSDGGRHWQNVTSQSAAPGKNAVGEFLTTQDAWIAWQAGGLDHPLTVQHTSDGGAHWQSSTINNITGGLAKDTLRFLNPQQGWLATSRAEGMLHYTISIYYTTDGGQSWSNISGAMRYTSISGLSFSDSQHGWAGLYWPGPAIQTLKTTNGGKTWQQSQLPSPAGITSEQIGETQSDAPVLIGATGLLPVHITMSAKTLQKRLVLYTTQNNGLTWQSGTLADFDSNDVYALDTQHVWAEEPSSNMLHYSSDGGKTWTRLAQTPSHFGALSFVDTHNGWAIDDSGHLYQTNDGGKSWQKSL